MRQGSVELRKKLTDVNQALQIRGTKWAARVSRKYRSILKKEHNFLNLLSIRKKS